MQKFFQSTLGMFTLFLLGALVLYLISAGFSGNWNQFQAADAGSQVPVLDANGTRTGKFITVANPAVARGRSCCNAGGGFIGNCTYPIKKTDNIPSCDTL